jgi:hypothetical protein
MSTEVVLTDSQLARLTDVMAVRLIGALDGPAHPPPPTPHSPKLALQRREAAASLSVGVDTFDRHIRPLLKCVYVGDLRLWPVAELERYLDEHARRPCDDEGQNTKRPPRRSKRPGARHQEVES